VETPHDGTHPPKHFIPAWRSDEHAAAVLDELARRSSPSVSIIIPTYNHFDLLKACLDSVVQYTDLSSCEVIVVANGCTDGTIYYLKTLPWPFRWIEHQEPLGFTAATNRGIQEARGEYLCLLNNDTVLLPQAKNAWIDILLDPLRKDPKAGITGPVKFSWDCGGAQRRAIAFWCAMIRKKLFDEIGPLDEIFSPGMGEDGDFSIKAEEAGYRLVQVPIDHAEEFGKGIPNQQFPIYHKGSGTFSDKDYSEVLKRNTGILNSRHGRKDDLEAIYKMCLAHECDTNKLFPTLRAYAEKCDHITEFGVRGVFTTWAFLARRPKRLVSYDIEYNGNIEGAKKEAEKAKVSFEFRQENTLDASIELTDLLFIDTTHTYRHLKAEIDRHSGQVKRYILIHDTESFGEKGADGGPGEKQAIAEFLSTHPEWTQKEHLVISNGLTILERKAVSISIVIPTAHHFQDALKISLEAVLNFTDLSDKEVIVVANGSPPEAIEYLKGKPIRLIEFPGPIGYIRAVNAGITAANGERVVLLDDDSFLMPQPKDEWIRMLSEPFLQDPKIGAAGPFGQTYPDLGEVLHSGCTMYKTAALREINLFDEAFNPGYMGDEDLAIRLRKAGYQLQLVPKGHKPEYVNGVFRINFPVVHAGTVNTMDKHGKDLPLVVKNRKLLYERHGMELPVSAHPKVSIVIPTFQHLEDILKPCLQTIIEFTDLSDVEVVVVANGCTDGTEDYVRSLGAPFKVLSFPDALGFTKATNEGLRVAQGDYLVLYNNDNMLLGQQKNLWLDRLLEPFKDNKKMGITGPLQLHDDYADADVIIGFCLCISRAVLQDAMADTGGLLDEAFSPGGGEDIDLCCRVRNKGYSVRQVPKEGKLGFSHTNTGDYPIWHRNNMTFKDIPEYTRYYVKRNGWINCKRYNKSIKLNLGSGGIEYPGFLSVDLHDRRAMIIQDITKLDFEPNTVAEMLAIHVLEHLSPYIVLDTLKLWHKLLKPGGKLTMELPDLESLCERYLKATTGQRYGLTNCIYGSVNTTGEGEPSDITSPHLYGWDKQMIFDHLCNAGFVNIQFMSERFPHPEPPNMSVDAYKP
jgi:GT2 family glycosyltransferase